MKPEELKKAIKAKIVELEISMSLGRPNEERLRIYKELKELQFQLIQVQYNLQSAV